MLKAIGNIQKRNITQILQCLLIVLPSECLKLLNCKYSAKQKATNKSLAVYAVLSSQPHINRSFGFANALKNGTSPSVAFALINKNEKQNPWNINIDDLYFLLRRNRIGTFKTR